MNKIFNVFLAFLVAVPTFAASPRPSPSSVRWRGELAIWKRPSLCPANDSKCTLPRPLIPNLPVELTLKEPSTPGRHVAASETFAKGEWQIELLVVWVKSPDRSPDYLVTQTRFSHERAGLVAECSRYDGARSFAFLPPGSCSGRIENGVYGVSLISLRD